MCSERKIGTFPASLDLKHAKPDSVLSPPRAITLTSAHFTPLVSSGLGLCVFWMEHFDSLFLACLCKTQSASMSNASSSSHFCLQASLPQMPLCPWAAWDLFSGVLPGAASAPVPHSCRQHPANSTPPCFLQVYLVEGWGCVVCFFGVVWFFIWAFFNIFYYYIIFIFSILFSANEEEQGKLWETSERGRTSAQTVPSAITCLQVVSPGLSSDCSRNNSHFSRFYLVPKRKAKRRASCSPGPSLPPRCLLYGLWSQKKETGPSHKVYLWLAACSYCRSTPAPEFGSASPPREAVHVFPERDGGKREKRGSIFILWNPKGLLFFQPGLVGSYFVKERVGSSNVREGCGFCFSQHQWKTR